ncbi:hypothetical protein BC361_01370 [Ensifer sp. LC54]|nr:hypothetical protein BC363_07890 [Ensifer sp. LC384]OCP28086.1 hypothetical protein BC361_01370 [Ensifer sp. LC54]
MNDHKAQSIVMPLVRHTWQDVLSDECLRQGHHGAVDFFVLCNEAIDFKLEIANVPLAQI